MRHLIDILREFTMAVTELTVSEINTVAGSSYATNGLGCLAAAGAFVLTDGVAAVFAGAGAFAACASAVEDAYSAFSNTSSSSSSSSSYSFGMTGYGGYGGLGIGNPASYGYSSDSEGDD